MEDTLTYERVSLDELQYEESTKTFYYPCPCGDLFEITLDEFCRGGRIAECPSCSLKILIIVNSESLESFREEYPHILVNA